eukprot:7859702-Heterocapsa_arctica.AAC.1
MARRCRGPRRRRDVGPQRAEEVRAVERRLLELHRRPSLAAATELSAPEPKTRWESGRYLDGR